MKLNNLWQHNLMYNNHVITIFSIIFSYMFRKLKVEVDLDANVLNNAVVALMD